MEELGRWHEEHGTLRMGDAIAGRRTTHSALEQPPAATTDHEQISVAGRYLDEHDAGRCAQDLRVRRHIARKAAKGFGVQERRQVCRRDVYSS